MNVQLNDNRKGYHMRNKFGAIKTTVDNIKFDSKAEARRYVDLKLLLRTGKIKDLKLQPRYEILPGYTIEGKRVRPTFYKPDFEYLDESGKKIVEDVKGVKTRDYQLRKKMFEIRYKIKVTEVTY